MPWVFDKTYKYHPVMSQRFDQRTIGELQVEEFENMVRSLLGSSPSAPEKAASIQPIQSFNHSTMSQQVEVLHIEKRPRRSKSWIVASAIPI